MLAELFGMQVAVEAVLAVQEQLRVLAVTAEALLAVALIMV
jgi:hypothetical protein